MDVNTGDLDGFCLGLNCDFMSNELFWMNSENSPNFKLLLTRLRSHKSFLGLKERRCPLNPGDCNLIGVSDVTHHVN